MGYGKLKKTSFLISNEVSKTVISHCFDMQVWVSSLKYHVWLNTYHVDNPNYLLSAVLTSETAMIFPIYKTVNQGNKRLLQL